MTNDADFYPSDEKSAAREEREAKERTALDERNKHDKQILLDGLWDDWCQTGDIDYLRLYIRRGGDIDDQEIRDLLADLIVSKNPGGSMPMENIRFYNHVRKLMDVNGMGKTEAVDFVAEQEGISNGWDRYKAGEKRTNGKH
jgi:hypothetical protein